MNIDEFIEYTKEKAEEYKYRACFFESDNPMYKACIKVAKDHEQLAEWLEKSKEYQQLEEQGRLVKLPCKIGDEVYNITWWDDVQEKVVVKGKIYCRTVRKHKVTKSIFSYFDILEFGKTVFLTRKEAEAKLKELRGEQNGKI